ncbi:alcohol dehydrogenase catalytic domain-containing protein [Candidatus Sumerlaeota bacterium]|nr:alcohol dehydrogenase catalytic domain-containing protein [Candidatus Sumerlaeota bacterium]
MKAMAMTGIGRIEMQEAPEPEITRDSDVLLRMGSVGVCGSDIHNYKDGRIGRAVVRFPFRLGHECAGTVLEVGPAVKNLKAGDRVAVDPAMPCFECDQCLKGRMHTCRNLSFLGAAGQADGCLCERIVMPETSLFPIRESTTLDQATVAEPLAIGYYAAQLTGSMEGKRIAVLGSGPIGLSAALSARAQGAERIYMTDVLDYRVQVAGERAADWVGNPDRSDVVAEIARLEPLGLDAVFECAGVQETVDQGVELLAPGGSLVIVGIPTVERLSFVIDVSRRKEIRLQNVRRQNECMDQALDLIESGKASVDFMVTHRFPFEKSQEAFDTVAEYRDGVVKAIISFE